MINSLQRFGAQILSITACAVFFNSPPAASASVLGLAVNFAVLGGQTVTNTGITTINGNLGVWPGSAYTGAGTVSQTGTVYLADGVAETAEDDAVNAYDYLGGLPVGTVLTGTDLGGLTLDPGVYMFSSSAQLTGTLTLDAENIPNALFVFEIGSTLTTASNSAVNVINGSAGDGVFFQVGSSATLGTGTAFEGNILALTSISLQTGATDCGRTLALNGQVSLEANSVSDSCGVGVDFNSGAFAENNSAAAPSVPEPGTVSLLFVGLLALALSRPVGKLLASSRRSR